MSGALFDGSLEPLGRIVCHCLLIETDAHGLVLVDTGYGLNDVTHPTSTRTPALRGRGGRRLRTPSIEQRGHVTVSCTHDPVELERCQAGTPL